MAASAVTYLENVSTKKLFFEKKNFSFNCSHLFFDIQWHVFTGIKCIIDVQELNM